MDIIPVVSRQNALKNLAAAWKAELHDGAIGFAYSNQVTAATIQYVNNIVQNDLQSGRDGARISLNRINTTYSVKDNGTVGAPTITRVRCALLWVKNPNGAAPTEAQIQETFTAGNDTISAIPNFQFQDQIQVLYDRYHDLSTVANPAETHSFSILLTGKQSTYVAGAGAGAVADILSGGLFWYVKADGNNTTANCVQHQLYFHP